MRPILSVFIPLAAGYFLSYFFRNANGPIAGDLVRDIGANAAGLGFLTAVYFLAFAAAQLPIGMALDRFGPRRVQAVLLVVAGGGAFLFAAAHDEFGLVVGRFFIGLGTAGCLMAGLKATRQWFPPNRLSSINGYFIMCGGLGALTATAPLTTLVELTGWRTTFNILATALLALAIVTYIFVPDTSTSGIKSTRTGSLKDIFRHRLFWRFAPMSALSFGTVTAFQGLWAALWFADVDQLKPTAVATHLLLMACGLIVGAPIFGLLARRFRSRMNIATMATIAAALLVVIEILIVLRAPFPDFIVWPLFAAFGALPVLSYGVLANVFPSALTGRANGMLNILHTSAAFALQSLIGGVINLWQRIDGVYPDVAYQSAFTLVIVLQIVAVFNFASALRNTKR